MTSSNNLNTLWKIPLVPLLFMCVRSHVHCFLYTTDHNVLDLLNLLLSLEMSRHSHGSWATNIITSTIHWELKRRHLINSGNSQKTPANTLLSVMMLTLLLLSLFYKWKNKLYSKIPLLVSDSSTYCSSMACARCPLLSNTSPFQRRWGILWCKCTIIYSSVWWAFWWFAVLCHEELGHASG